MYIYIKKVFLFCGVFVIASTLHSCSCTENTGFEVDTADHMDMDNIQNTRPDQRLKNIGEVKSRQARGMDSDDDHDHDHYVDDHTTEKMKEMAEQKAASDPWGEYYDFIINEGSFKFWAVFQLVTAVLLIYSAFAAVYYAKFNVITTDYDYYDDFLGRGRSNTESPLQSMWSGLSSQTFQRIFDAISSKKYT